MNGHFTFIGHLSTKPQGFTGAHKYLYELGISVFFSQVSFRVCQLPKYRLAH